MGFSSPLYLLGAGAHAREIACIAKQSGFDVSAFFSDNEKEHGKFIFDKPVIGPLELSPKQMFNQGSFLVAVGDVLTKVWLVNRAQILGAKFTSIIHPSINYLDQAIIGQGSILFPNTVISTNVYIGSHVSINLACSISHDVIISDYCNLSPGVRLTGNVFLDEGVDIGTGASILPKVKLGKYSIVGAGAIVIEDVPAGATVVGVPAKVIKVNKLFL